MEAICLYTEVPICSFRPEWSREYQDTYSFPPPATVFGMLLSLVGVDWYEREKHAGVHLAMALEKEPERASIFRKFRRVPQADAKADPLTARRPDYQDLLLGLKLWIWLKDGEAEQSLVEEVQKALDPLQRRNVNRYGGLSLGESSHLVNEVGMRVPMGVGNFLCRNENGFLKLPIWVRHQRHSKDESVTRLHRFSILHSQVLEEPPIGDTRWITIQP